MAPLSLVLAMALAFGSSRDCRAGDIDFDRDIRPILSNHCYHCHGPDMAHREAGLRLDVRESAVETLESGNRAIVPGNPAASELVRRLLTDDAGERMPPDDRKPLRSKQRELLQRWIAEGAEFTQHWSFVVPESPAVPTVRDASWPKNPIDHFVLERLQREGVTPSQFAAPAMLLRRVHLDLTGLPPTPAQVARYVQSPSDEAYLAAVDALLQSEHFAERMAMFWLDAARYSDTDGFQQDATRTNWPWRDWVVNAFHRNMPFDQFTLEQFAGDLLPDARPDQILATCFHRNHMTNGEGGRDPEESRIDYVIDRVNTTGTVWLGLTLGCCQCHSHKYDPVSQREYYQLFAFFNSIDENGRAGSGAKPYLGITPKDATRWLNEADAWLKETEAAEARARNDAEPRFQAWLAAQRAALTDDFAAWQILDASQLSAAGGTTLRQTGNGIVQATGIDPHHEDYQLTTRADAVIRDGRFRRITGLKLEVLPHSSHTDGGLSRSDTGHFILSDVKLRVRSTAGNQVRDIRVASAIADYSANPGKNGGYGNIAHTLDDDPRNGWASFGAALDESRVAVFALAEPLVLADDDEIIIEMQQRALRGRHNIGRFRWYVTDQRGDVPKRLDEAPLEALARRRGGQPDIDAKLLQRLRSQYLEDDPDYGNAAAALATARQQRNEAKRAAGKVNVMVLQERSTPRTTHVLTRGVWNQHGDEVERGFPAALGPSPDDAPLDRVQFARWLTHRDNPLTARVVVNHLWRLAFGVGLVRTAEDFGAQGDPPTHPELLDWLAVEFMESGWDVKHILRLMVISAAYRQTSDSSPELVQRDPQNRWLARATRRRLPAWMIRDQALAVSGLLNRRVGGPPVRPYQPGGVWADITMGRFRYVPSEGPTRHRRTLYTFWRRSAAPAFLFDNAQRRVCEVATATTNTPLHALTLLNDITMLEASRALALRSQAAESTMSDRVASIWRSVLCREPAADELRTLLAHADALRDEFAAAPKQISDLLTAGQHKDLADTSGPEVATLTVVAGMILNLDEAMTRE